MPDQNIMEENKEAVMMEMQETELTEMISINVICRLCANQNDKLIGIYSEDGIHNDLANKMNLYLPIKVNETDELPLQCCWQCASTVLAWHELVITSAEADRRLRSYQFVSEKQLEINFQSDRTTEVEKANEVEPVNTCLNAFCQAETNSQNLTEKIDKDSTKTALDTQFGAPNNDNLTDFVNIEHQYLQLNNDLYDIKIEEKVVQPPEHIKLSEIYQDADDSLSDQNEKEDLSEENQSMLFNTDDVNETKGLIFYDNISDDEGQPSENIAPSILTKSTSSEEKNLEKTVSGSQTLLESQEAINVETNTCNLCSENFPSSAFLTNHMNKIHQLKKPKHRRKKSEIDATFVCPTCNKGFTRKFDMQKHILNKHPNKKNEVIPSKRAKNLEILEKCKLGSHEGDYYKCDICEQKFIKGQSLLRHRNIHCRMLYCVILIDCIMESKILFVTFVEKHLLTKQHVMNI
ncbi:hypothetical protein NQ318_016330 [Aromia moschata]|uniref:Uncharacterized protein n=1 Tax=Aromia moschata TaxID=1265417 RepID=A0AAV8Z5U4_9CUCU|nr:hypothetical protein NQ318_016330 [Aromia moschata]